MSHSIVPVSDAVLAAAITLGEQLARMATAPGLAFTLEELGDINIPEPSAAQMDRAQLRALATLYLAADLEPAGIIPSVELLTGLASGGGSQFDLGGAAPLVEKWWRQRHQRVSAAERNAFFSRLFGTANGPVAADADRNFQFEDRMLELCEAMIRLDEVASSAAQGVGAQRARIGSAVRNLTQNLAQASGGITAYLAGEIITMLKEAFAIVGHPDMRGRFAARDIWGVVAGIKRLGRIPQTPATVYVRRGKAGMIILSWLAEDAGRGSAPLSSSDPVIGAAYDWLQASLEIGEAATTAPPQLPVSDHNGAANSPSWSALGG